MPKYEIYETTKEPQLSSADSTEYKKLVEEAPYHPGYEDAVITPRSNPVYQGMDPAKFLWKPKPLSDEEITNVFVECLLPDGEFDEHEFAKAIEERHGIK